MNTFKTEQHKQTFILAGDATWVCLNTLEAFYIDNSWNVICLMGSGEKIETSTHSDWDEAETALAEIAKRISEVEVDR